jgi:hypothetical protein
MKRILLISILALQTAFVWATPNDSTRIALTKDSVFHLSFTEAPVETYNDVFEEGFLPVNSNDSIQRYIDLARAVMNKIRKTGNFIKTIDAKSKFELPAGISKTIGGVTYELGIHAMRLKPTHAELDVFLQFKPPQQADTLTFMAKGIKFSSAGGILGDARLELLGTYGINFNGDKIQLVLKGGTGGSGTYVTIDCDGFKEMGLDADIIFSRDLLVPENLNGTVQPQGRVSASFTTVLSNWNDLVVQVSLPNFQATQLSGFGFSVQNMVFDFSDARNASGVVFPPGYQTETEPGLSNLWRGFYARELTVRLPSHFKNKDNTRTSFSATDLIIDNQGVSGKFTGKSLIPLNNGDMNGWAFSIDEMSMELVANHIKQAGLQGSVVVPVSDEQTPFRYSATFGDNNQYLFTVSPAENMQFKVWQTSKVDIHKGSRLEIKLDNGKFLPKAVLHGQMSISAKLSEKGQGVTLADLRFENLEIQSVKPFIKVGNFSFGSEALQQKMAGFPISIQNVGMRQITDTQTGLDFSLLLNLTGESSGAFAAEAGLTVIGVMGTEGGSQKWKFKDFEVRKIAIDINQGDAFKFNGSLTFYRNDLVYGDGFNGSIDATFLSKIKVQSSAIFGSVAGQRYWYVDAMVQFKPGIVFMPGVAFYGFGGGAYQYMKMAPEGKGSELGKTVSGLTYIPDTRTFLGVKAIVNLGSAGNEQAFNADVTLEITFFKGGGIRTISLIGNAFIATPKLDGKMDKMMASAKKMAGSFDKMEANAMASVQSSSAVSMASKAGVAMDYNDASMSKSIFGGIGDEAGDRGAISAHAFIQYDFENRELHGNFSVSIKLAGGVIQGGGEAVLHFAPAEWYVYVGTPDQRIQLSFGIGPIKANATSYFMVGSKIPGSPPPPKEVSEILGGMDLDYMKDLNSIGSGGGFAFGASFTVDTGDLKFLMFYARFQAGAGFDIMLKDYGDTYCEGSNKRIGINGWYANGQAYAFFKGDIGIRVRIFGRTKKVEILNIAAAAVLQTQLPNPFWMRGVVGGRFRVLGGLVSGKCKFQVTLGKKCEMIRESDDESALDNVAVIAQLTPTSGETEVNVFNSPQVVFNMPVDKPFELRDDDGATRSFRINLDHFRLVADGVDILGGLEWNDANDVLAFNSIEVLPPKKQINAFVQVSFQENKNGQWIKVIENGQAFTEKSEISFTTGLAPDYIPLSNVEYSYPVIGQLNFYKDESTEGYVKLKKGQGYLFEPSVEWNQVGRFTAVTGAKAECGISYSNQMIGYTIPSSSLSVNTVYAFEFINVPKAQSGPVDRNVTETTNKLPDETIDLEMKSRKAEGSIATLQEKSIYSCGFKSSAYGSFANKIDGLAATFTGDYLNPNPYHQKVFTWLTGSEYFDKAELAGIEHTANKPMIQMETDLSGNGFYNSRVAPLVYAGYPLDGDMVISNRSANVLGVPPVKATYINQTPSLPTLNDMESGSGLTVAKCEYIFDLPKYMYADFLDIQTKVVQRYINQSTPPARMLNIMTGIYPRIEAMQVTYKISYILPSGKKTSTKQVTVKY